MQHDVPGAGLRVLRGCTGCNPRKAKKGAALSLLEMVSLMSTQQAEFQMSIIEDKANPLMERRELRLEIVSNATPKRDLIRGAIASSLKVSLERVYVRSTLPSFGTSISICKVHVYNDEKRGKSIEPAYIQMRNLSREARKQALSAAVAKAAKPAEEKAQAQTKVK